MLKEEEQIKVFVDALPHVQQLSRKPIVIKYGGAAMLNKSLKYHVINDLIFLSSMGLQPILIHGGGPAINHWLQKLSIKPSFHNGVRVTDAVTMQVVEMVLAGIINKELVMLVNTNGGSAVGLSGKDGSLVLAESLDIQTLGFVGNIVSINIKLLSLLLEHSYIPIIASVSYSKSGYTYNINADILASRIAIALSAEKLIFLTDTPGILLDVNNSSSLIKMLDISLVYELQKKGIISGGMIPKVQSCVNALKHGVKSAHIIDGRVKHSLLSTILTKNSYGSTLVRKN